MAATKAVIIPPSARCTACCAVLSLGALVVLFHSFVYPANSQHRFKHLPLLFQLTRRYRSFPDHRRHTTPKEKTWGIRLISSRHESVLLFRKIFCKIQQNVFFPTRNFCNAVISFCFLSSVHFGKH
jgi:hypothetical protein